MFTTIISAIELAAHIENANWRIIECSFDLKNTHFGRQLYQDGHIPGALYAHLDEDLSGDIRPGQTGRHPLPSITKMVALCERLGISSNTQVVVYDNKRGAIAARLWWMLRYLGHTTVAVLDGGRAAWSNADLVWSDIVPVYPRGNFQANVQYHWLVDTQTVAQLPHQADTALVDSRTAPRYRGEEEPIDPIAGHIPGAINLPFPDNWTSEGLLRPPRELHQRFEHLLTTVTPIFYCGSGVTACYNILAYTHAGLGNARLYAGSWSEWITSRS